MRGKAENSAGKPFEKIAKENGVSVDEVRREIKNAIAEALKNSDPKIQEFWSRVPRKGDIPTPEELISFLTGQMIKL